MKDGLNFFHVFRVGPYIGVNKVGAGDVAMNYLLTLIVMFIIVGLVAIAMPIFISLLYIIVLLTESDSDVSKGDKFYGSLFIVIASTYFIIDCYFGWLGCAAGQLVLGYTWFKYLFVINTVLGIVHLYNLITRGSLFDHINNGARSLPRYFLLIIACFVLFGSKAKTIADNILDKKVENNVEVVE
jgi:hypothetical protein